MQQENQINDVIDVLKELCGDNTVPKNIKARLEKIISYLNHGEEMSVKVNKALHDLDEIGDDTNLQPYVRTQIWNISSMLEKF
ncbi:hypothetical protein GF323_03965 [Candidatus Woesearchaeota archaeon]|nr:hypothetical protein [Candidatus Woesearchaeota archaeon]